MTKEELELKLLDRPHSPLFARLADEYLAAGRIDDAKKICSEGLKKFPGYGTAHLILSKCHFVENNFALALASVENAQACIPDPDLLEGLCEELLAVISKGGGLERADEPTESIVEPGLNAGPVTEEPPAEPDGVLVDESSPAAIAEIPAVPSEEIQEEIVPVAAEERPVATAAPTDQQLPLESEPAEVRPEGAEAREAPSEIPPQSSAVVEETAEEPDLDETVPEDMLEAAPESPEIRISSEQTPSAEPVSKEVAEVAPVEGLAPADQLPNVEESAEVSEPAGSPVSTTPPEEIPTVPGEVAETAGTAEYQPTETDRIITRTLAEIYASQKAYDEAIVTYRLLKEQKPECMEEIDARIAELQRLQQEKSRE